MHVQGHYLLRKGDEKKEVAGFPNVPNEYQAYLLTKPIEAAIVAVGPHTTRPSVCEWKFKDTPVTIDAGARQGVRVGMKLVITYPKNIVESMRVTKVEQTRADGIVTQMGEDESDPKPGWRLSTQAPWYKPDAGKSRGSR